MTIVKRPLLVAFAGAAALTALGLMTAEAGERVRAPKPPKSIIFEIPIVFLKI